ncbi:MAG: triple tyrosine motif-containing protein [Candidatus Kryptonium sp.]
MRYFYIFSIFLALVGCNIVTEPPPPERENPIDPKSPGYQPPKAEIISGPSNNSIVTEHTVTFKWRGNQADNLMSFSYKLDNQPWSEWRSVKEVTFTYLDEGKHTFMVKAKYINNIEQQEPTQVNFTVDAVKGPALMFVPRKVEVRPNSSFDTEVYIEEASDFAGVKIIISYNTSIFDVENVEVYKDSKSILLKNGGNIIDFVSVDKGVGRVEINLAVAGGNPTNVNGTGPIGKIRFKVLPNVSSGTSSEIKFDNSSTMRNSDNQAVQIKELVPEVVKVF